ncbi:beta-1,4-N-acetylglucosamine oligosaccharide 3-O-carbamoyltransferase NolO [Paenibacillus algorifonticola]|uniref:Beta-1,4-N-acetylglucosamine oligosaccharide 3-O-carbamoyltransferase NolO n=1 Tax=Paenibacillus algorifonticola TaxID=684063 RepID=A0A1I1YTA5_9BACL|nr:carbamoyltransferase C-terminal domain-containing protein [Paenibacillus algorifonticola]SFE22776.1 beta-1,4-N-acetylglucosamine oligosaccharide 3-O-carbamoyltransferase NolO [Paenibacillus algorifonticola]
MRILGISGGIDFPHEDGFVTTILNSEVHDASAVLIENGQVVAAYEEERLNRIKHSGKLPILSIRRCLELGGIRLDDVDKIVFYCEETQFKYETTTHRHQYRQFPYSDPKAWIVERLKQFFDTDFKKENVVFENHHYCHAASAYYMSGFDEALVVTIDGASLEGNAGIVLNAEGNSLKPLSHISNDDSLGAFYTQIIEFLGYTTHDEYKVMGLAPYGDPAKFRRLFKKAFTLLPEGKFRLNRSFYYVLMDSMPNPRLKGELFTQEHKDIAAALQEALENVVMHMLVHYQQATGRKKLCMAGGVAHNCTLNGKILYSGLFDEVFVQPAAHDAGNALGGALLQSRKLAPSTQTETLRHLYWGSAIQNNDSVLEILKQWERFVTYRKADHVVEVAAKLMAEGAVIGWAQGRSEFGPRALGNRSILADPRPAENKSIINAMVKKREGYRPFAPSILEEYADDYYVLPQTKAPYSYMNFVLKTREDKQELLGAVTHVDGTARIQTVSRETNEKYWHLIDEFRKLTGVPVLLNTSFNNNAEPIVDSEEDAIVSFLTTNINTLIIGDYVIDKKTVGKEEFLKFVPKRPISSELKQSVGYTVEGNKQTAYEIRLHFGDKYKTTLSEEMYRLLEQSDGEKTLAELIELRGCGRKTEEDIVDELIELWSLRLIHLRPFETVALATV